MNVRHAFNILDRVRVKNEWATSSLPSGATGTVVAYNEEMLKVEWDQHCRRPANGKKISTGGWQYFKFENLTLIAINEDYSIE